MYGKLFDQMYDSSLCECWQALITFQQMIVLADSQGVIDMTPEAIHRRTNIPLDIIKTGIVELEKPDPRSRSPQAEGRRLERLDQHRDWGWQIVNHQYYRDLASMEEKREADRLRIAEKRAKEKALKQDPSQVVAGSRGESPQSEKVAKVAYTDTDAEAIRQKTYKVGKADRFAEWWRAYPKKVKKKPALKTWKARGLDALADLLITDTNTRKAEDYRWKRGFAPDPTTYLNQDRWDDEITHAPAKAA